MTFRMKARRAGWLLVVAAFALGIVGAAKPAPTEAYGLLGSRYIRMSSSASAADNTAYAVGFNTVTANQSVGAVAIKFCANSPIIGETTCTLPNLFNTNYATLTLNNYVGAVTGLTINTSLSNNQMVVLTRTGGPQASVVNGTISFTLGNGTTNGILNPTATNQTFYARILVYPTITPDLTASGENTATDAGGTAMATVNVLNVTAKVQETLVFCVWLPVNNNCAGGGSSIALGDTNGVLSDTAATYTSGANFDLASNALGGVVVKLKGNTLTSGAFSITPYGATCTADLTTTSSEQFGLRVVSYGAGQDDPISDPTDAYDCLAGNHKFDVAKTNTTYGQDIVATAGATDRSTTNLELAAKAAGTTEAGIYTTTLQMIATATY